MLEVNTNQQHRPWFLAEVLSIVRVLCLPGPPEPPQHTSQDNGRGGGRRLVLAFLAQGGWMSWEDRPGGGREPLGLK